jgi:hypothetical protein
MNRYLILFLVITVMLYSCQDASNTSTKAIASKSSLQVVRDTIKMDAAANRDMMIILSILPDTLTKSFQWTRAQRGKMRASVEKNGYYLDSNAVFKSFETFKNNHLNLTLPNGKFLLSTYQIQDGHYIILTVETSKGKQTVHGYEIYKSSSMGLSHEELFGKYSLSFLSDPSSQSCLGMLYERNPDFDFVISEDDKVKISMKNYNEDNSKGCLKGNYLTLKFNVLKLPFDSQSITWED